MFGLPSQITGITMTTKVILAVMGVVLAIAALLIIPNMDNIREKLGFETKATLKAQVEVQKIQLDTVVDANKNLKEAVVDEKQLGAADVAAITDLDKKEKVNEAAVIQIEEKRVEKIRAIKAVAKAPIVKGSTASIKTPKVIEDEISMAQITSVWETFCQYNPSAECSAQINGV